MKNLQEKPKNISAGKAKVQKLFLHAISLGIWTYFIVTLFLFDLNSFFISLAPQWEKYIRFKFIPILFFIAFLWRYLGTKVFMPKFLFILFYPFILPVTIIFRLMGFSPNALLAVIGSFVLTIRSARKWFFSFIAYFCLLMILYVDFGKIITVLAMAGLFILLILHYLKRLYSAFRPETLISRINNFIEIKWVDSRDSIVLKDLSDSKRFPPGSAAFKAKKFEKIMFILLFNVLYRFIITQLKTFHESRLLAIVSVSKLVMSFFVTVIVYGFEYFALNRLVPESFSTLDSSSIFFYLYASLNTIVNMTIKDFSSSWYVAQLMTASQILFGLSLLIIFVFIFFNIVNERHQNDLQKLIRLIDKENLIMCEFLSSHFDTTLEDIQQLEGIDEESQKNQIIGIVKLKTDLFKIKD